ncbi:MAG: GntR family transcriptional regulator, partial [Mucilaginibacter sp.]
MEKLQIPVDNDFLYAQIASRIEEQIKQNLLRSGDKLPYVRALSQEQGISISTAYKAYVELENMGMIEARPKSGYYVKFSATRFTKAPETKPPLKKIEQTSVGQMIAMVYQNMPEDSVLGLSRSSPPLSLIPMAKLSKSMVAAMRKSPSANINYENLQGNLSLRKQVAKNAFNWGGHI